jgi:hypothetical protein
MRDALGKKSSLIIRAIEVLKKEGLTLDSPHEFGKGHAQISADKVFLKSF